LKQKQKIFVAGAEKEMVRKIINQKFSILLQIFFKKTFIK